MQATSISTLDQVVTNREMLVHYVSPVLAQLVPLMQAKLWGSAFTQTSFCPSDICGGMTEVENLSIPSEETSCSTDAHPTIFIAIPHHRGQRRSIPPC
ncbi:hypothetical protein E2P81_ATG04645 [Venturia nashicola]|nr:hypothetical protein E2P81_ATG04645 [Venturia nashicola]